jgi:hypothetical protein
MNKIRKALTFAALSIVAAASLLLLKPVRAWATAEGSYLYNQFVLQGPAYIFKSRIGGAQGLVISTSAYTGSSQTGVPTAGTGTALTLIGGQTSAQRATCAAGTEGQFIYDPTVHSIAFCNGTSWYKSVDSGSAVSWTIY